MKTTLFSTLNSALQSRLRLLLILAVATFGALQYQFWLQSSAAARDQLVGSIQKRLLAIARSGALLMDPVAHGAVFDYYDFSYPEFQTLRAKLRSLKRVNQLQSAIYTLRLEDLKQNQARFVVMTNEDPQTGKPYIAKPYEFPDSLKKAFVLGLPVTTDVYQSKSDEGRRWMSAIAPFRESDSNTFAVLEVDISVEDLLSQLEAQNQKDLFLALLRTLGLVLFFFLLWLGIRRVLRREMQHHIESPLKTFLEFVSLLNQNDLSPRLNLQTGDEIQSLAESFNSMVSRLQESQNQLQRLNNSLEEEVQKKTLHVRSLLDNAGQGFLRFNPAFEIEEPVSRQCHEWFGENLEGQEISQILFPAEEERKEFQTWFQKAFEQEVDPGVIADLAPAKTQIQDHTLGLQYRPIQTEAGFRWMLIATDISAEERLKSHLKREETLMRQLLQVLEHPDEARSIGLDLTTLQQELNRWENGEDILQVHYRRVHTLKGLAGSLHMQDLQQTLHEYEDLLQQSNTGHSADFTRLQESLNSTLKCGEQTIAHLQEKLGDAFNWYEETLCVPRQELETWLQQPALPPVLQRGLHKYLTRSVKEGLKPLIPLIEELAEEQEKLLNPIQIEGEDLRVMPRAIEPVLQNLPHLARNMVDHGLEGPEQRESANKDAFGNIQITVDSTDREIQLTLTDDGRGMEPATLRQKCLEKNLISEAKLQTLSDEESLELIFLPGFSSAETLTEISGRGVGMDALKAAIHECGGRITVQSTPLEGTTFVIHLPLKRD